MRTHLFREGEQGVSVWTQRKATVVPSRLNADGTLQVGVAVMLQVGALMLQLCCRLVPSHLPDCC